MIKIGVIGVGRIGKIHVEQLLKIPNTQLMGIYDINSETGFEIASLHNIKCYNSFDELLEVSDALIISTSSPSHFELSQKAIKAGKHIFIEKPMTTELSQALEIVQMYKEGNIICMIGHVERFNPAYVSVKNQISNPLFLECHRLAAYSPRMANESVILDVMIHDIDIVLSLVKSEINRISATGVKVISDTIDIANARIEFSNGCIANLTASRIAQKEMRKTRVFQKDAYFNIDFLHRQSECISLQAEKPIEEQLLFPIDLPNGDLNYMKILKNESNDSNLIHAELSYFIDCIEERKTPFVTAETAYEAMEVAHKILKKINSFND